MVILLSWIRTRFRIRIHQILLIRIRIHQILCIRIRNQCGSTSLVYILFSVQYLAKFHYAYTLTHSFVSTQSFASNTIRIKEINIKPGSSDIAFYNLIFMSLFSQVKSTTVMRRIKSRRKNPLAPHRSRRNLPNHPTLNPRSLPRINLPNRTAGRPTASHPRPLATASKVLSHHRY